MISNPGSDPGDEVPEADWAEQQVAAKADPAQRPDPSSARSSTTEANPADLADQDLEVDLDDDDA